MLKTHPLKNILAIYANLCMKIKFVFFLKKHVMILLA
jgi:hypothetical protein